MKKIARQLQEHRTLLTNWFRAKGQFPSGIIEGFNDKAKLPAGKSYRFSTYHVTEIELYHAPVAMPAAGGALEFLDQAKFLIPLLLVVYTWLIPSLIVRRRLCPPKNLPNS